MKGQINIFDSISKHSISSNSILSTLQNFKDQNISEIDVFINSPGGSVFEGFAIFNLLRDFPKVNTYVNGIAASIASVIALAGHKVFVYKNSYLMVHNPWSIQIGDHKDMGEEAETLEKIRDTLIDLYKSKTGMNEDELKKFCNNNTFIDSQTALDLKFIDEVIDNYPSQKFVAFYSDVVNDQGVSTAEENDLVAQLADLETDVANLTESNIVLTAKVEELEGQLSTAEGDLAAALTKLDEAKAQIPEKLDFSNFLEVFSQKVNDGHVPPYVDKTVRDLLNMENVNSVMLNEKLISLLSFVVDLNLLSNDFNSSPVVHDHSSFAGLNVTKESLKQYDEIMQISLNKEISFTQAFNIYKNRS